MTFECLDATIAVREVADLLTDGEETDGEFDAKTDIISIRADLPAQRRQHVFLHEFYHCAFSHGGYPELDANEQLIDMLAGLHAQMLKTAR